MEAKRMKKSLVILITIAAVILIGNVLIASAQNGVTPGQPGTGTCQMGYTCPYSGTLPFGGAGGMMGGGNHAQLHNAMMAANGMHQQVMTAVATKLGMTYDQLIAALQNGQTIAQLAEAKGVSLDVLQQAANTARTNAIDALVEQGVITREQADWMIDHMNDMPTLKGVPVFGFNGSSSSSAPSNFGPGMMNGRGMMGGRGGMTLAPALRSGASAGVGRWTQPTGPQG
jgi:hypothetical protein